MNLVVERIGYDGEVGKIALTFQPGGIHALAQEALSGRDAGEIESPKSKLIMEEK